MIRLLIYLLVITGLAALITMLLSIDGALEADVRGYNVYVEVGVLLILVLMSFLAFGGLVWLISYLMRLPGKLAARRLEGKRQRGMLALTRGLEAVAAGDPEDAQRHARNAQKQLDEPALTRLLTAQAAQLAGDDETAEESFAAMLDAPETEFLGLRGLYLQALSSGDNKSAKGYADRAFKLRPNARWAFESVYQLSIDRGGWGEAQNALKLAARNGLAEGEHVRRKEAALLTARAYTSHNSGNSEEALKDLKVALKQAPGFAPAAVLAANLEGEKGNTSRAARIIEEAWSIAPHPALVKAYETLYNDEDLKKRTDRLIRLAEKAPDRDESRLLTAQQYILREEWETAKDMLEPLLQRTPNARTFNAMAEAMRGLYGEVQARPWFAKAASAPLEPVPGVDGEFHFTTEGWRRLVVEYGEHNRLAPPPLEEVSGALGADEIKLLTAPPPEPEVSENNEVDEADAQAVERDETEEIPAEEPESKSDQEEVRDKGAAPAELEKANKKDPPPPDAVVTGLPD
ncbi:heme biosynthesis protein HemY [Parvularcula sp. IMCC14364]|uniref:heme biosynthesis protein HemY n=1 Tax=Parvularcula sp. IMCC14364 TaxID=3067902 RepID=UPI0027409222|nr:heme biosynthesis HemY N-terminal domain-containing protein [Parvularcula sp. IMCC14364]